MCLFSFYLFNQPCTLKMVASRKNFFSKLVHQCHSFIFYMLVCKKVSPRCTPYYMYKNPLDAPLYPKSFALTYLFFKKKDVK